uniref:Chloroplast protein-transporting ATPase n=1 Tax=Panagrolaimus sp. ES5 TaxID=591445 RepID=A0AC34F413_9BILA
MAILYAVNSEKHLLEQVNTGEGKSYIIAATAIIRRLVDYRYVDIITSSPVLAERDSAEMASFYHHFGLEVGHNCNENTEERKKAYQYDVVYGDIAHFQRDYLLHTFYKKEMLGSRTRECVIVDEVDNMLLDNGNNMLYLSHNVAGLNLLDSLLIFIQKQVYEPMYSGIKTDQDILQNAFSSTKIKEAVLADIFGRFTLPDVKKISTHQMAKKSIEEAFNKLISANIVDLDGYLLIHRIDQLDSLKSLFSNDKIFAIRLENSLRIVLQRRREIDVPHCFREFVKFHLDELIKNCKSAMFLAVDHEYVVDIDRKSSTNALEPRITIIDSNTGADLVTSQWSGGFHQFLQLKHGCRIAPITLKAVFVSNVAYLKGYSKINGLSGTLGSMHESKTLIDLYEADLIKIPTFKLKRFYEHVPVIATNQEDWFQSIFHEVCDQITDNRSVLIICESIAQVRLVHSQLESRYAKMDNPTTEISECFNTVTTYQREFDEFDFGDNNPLQCSRMIIATNLAGRGTDIKLSDALVFAGGLCVLTTFLPSNTRIEEQAFGRAARCGQPGSAEIIALSSTDDGIQPSIFQLKMFRDNAEVHRLATLKSYYDFHTEIEEECLKKFQNHCSKAVSSIYSSSGKNSDNVLPTPSQIVYFALLDKWALWLDSNSGMIELCSKNPNESEKQAIIDSVDEFLAKHPFGKSSECYEVAKNWIDFPQSLISLGIIQMCHTDGFSDAEKTFDRIVADGTEFAAEVYYYKACMRMKQWSDTRSALNSLTIKEKAEFKENIEEAIEYFTKSRALFTARVQRRQAEAKIVTQFCDTAGANHISTVGFAQQHKDINTAYELIISNIDWLIGTPCKSDMFLTKEIDHVYGAGIYESFVRQGVISPNLICSAELEKWQLQILRERLKLSKKDVEKLLHDSKNDSRICLYDGKHVMDKGILMSHVKLANRTGFFTQLQRMGVFEADLTDEIEDDDSGCEDGSSEEDTKDSSAEDKDEELILSTVKHVLFVNREDLSKLPDKLQKLPSLPPETDEQLRYQIRLNSRNSDEIITYDYNDILSINDESFVKTEITELINSKVLKDDWIAQVNLKNLGNITYCDSFDGITTSEIKEFFEIDLAAAAWILEALTEFDVLKQDTVLQHRFNADDKFWAEKVEIYQKDNKNITDDNQIATHARSLTFIRNIPSIKNVTPAVIKHACDFTDDQKLVEFCKLLIAEKILEPYLSTKFRLTGKLDCSCLPESIAEEVEEFLNERLAYSFGIEYLAAAIDRSATDPRVSKEILLADDPHGELYQTLMDLGIILPSRIFTNDYNHLESNDYKFFEKIQAVIFEHRLKLYDQTWAQMEFLPSAAYFNSREHQVDEETRQIIKNGTLMMIASKEASTVWKLSIEVMNLISKCAKTVWSVVKAVGSFFYAIGAGYVKYVVSPIVETAIDVFDYCAEAAVDVASDIKKGIVEAVDYIAETAIVKAATETVKEAAKAVAEVAVNVGGAVGKAAEAVGDAVIYASEVTGVTAAAKAVGNAAVTASEAIGTAAAATGKAIADVGIAAGNAIGNAAKSVANTVASTAAYKAAKAAVETALETVKYTYKKMASYVTACVESYQYYNQCRLSARHLAIEKRGIIDEYTILRSFNEATTKQNRIELNDQIFEENVQIHLTNEANKWISNITELIKKQISKEFKQHKIRCNSDDLNEILQTSLSIIRVKTEITEHLATFSNLTKVLFYQLIKEFAVKENQNMSQLSVSSLQLIGKYDYSLILEAVIGLCNEVKENLDNNNLSLDGDNLVNVSEAVTVSTKKLVDSLALSIYVEPSMKLISVYLLECRKPPQLASMASFSANDVNLKKILTDFNDSNNSKKNSKALKEATFKLIQNLLEKFPNDKSIYRFAFKYGYPLPLKSAEMIAMAIHNTLCADHKPKVSYKSGVTLKIFDQIQTDNITSETPLFTFKTASTAKMNVQIGHVNHQLFLSQHDFEAYFGDKSTEDSNIAFFYEGLIKALPMVKGYFPRYHESFRESLIKYI